MSYEEYIKAYRARTNFVFGKCQEASKEMKEAFPELTIVRGHITDAYWGVRGHWWLIDLDGNIVDPTASQFPALLEYIAWKPGDPILVGACMECGNSRYRKVANLDEPDSFCDNPGEYIQDTFCSLSCEEAFSRSF